MTDSIVVTPAVAADDTHGLIKRSMQRNAGANIFVGTLCSGTAIN